MKYQTLSVEEMRQTKGGEAVTLAAIMALLAIGVTAVVCYRIFFSGSGKTQLPGGFVFQWGK
ncbi:MAG: hypothetical protein LKM30_08020 [Bacilli bacterium]|jgi:hypothetical protein|nr:hypothetical protein [Bacilli bacterium]